MKERVLIVDGDRDHAHGLAGMLETRGHPVRLAHNREEAVAQLGRAEFDLILLDLDVPGMTGAELTKIRPTARIVTIRGCSLERTVARAIEAGALGVLHKPIAATRLLEALAPIAAHGTLLVADGDRQFVESIAPILEAGEFRLRLAADGRAALAELAHAAPDCLILDPGLALLAGPDVLARLIDACRNVPTILVAGGNDGAREGPVADPCPCIHGLLSKPFALASLPAAMGAAAAPAE